METRLLYGLMAEFREPAELVAATERAYQSGYRQMEGYTPFPVEGLAEALGRHGTTIPLIVLIGGILGGLGGYFMQWYSMVIDERINVGGRPFHSWPAFIPITFELTVLSASLFALVGLFALNRLPQPYHPVFNAQDFHRASQDRFFLCIEAADPAFDLVRTREFLESLRPEKVVEVRK